MFSVKLPETSVAMADEKLRALDAGAPHADVLVGCDASCLMHLQARADAAGRPSTPATWPRCWPRPCPTAAGGPGE